MMMGLPMDSVTSKRSSVSLAWVFVALGVALTILIEDRAQATEASTRGGRIAMMSPQFQPIIAHEDYVFVANTPNHTVDVIAKQVNRVVRQIPVGIEPVGLAIRPDGKELWVANHVSDSVSIVDIQPASQTFFQIVHTIQDIDPKTHATRFDEPVGIVFASNQKAYVSLSSENQIAVIDTTSRTITKRLRIPAQDPRGMAVRDGRLYVIPFESNNQTQLSITKRSYRVARKRTSTAIWSPLMHGIIRSKTTTFCRSGTSSIL